MPIYAFACKACGHAFERLQRLADADPTVCPECGVDGQIARQLTAPQFRLAGAGWYETDFKKEGDTKRNLADKPGGDAVPAAAAATAAAPAAPSGSGSGSGSSASVPAAPSAPSAPAAKPAAKPSAD